MAHFTIGQLQEINRLHQNLIEAASRYGLETSLNMSMYNSPDEDEIFDTLSLRVEEPNAKDSLYFEHITRASAIGWHLVEATFQGAISEIRKYGKGA